MLVNRSMLRLMAPVWTSLALAGCGGSSSTAPTIGDGFGTSWQPAGAQPALAARACPEFDCFGVSDPALLRLPGGEQRMWYTAGGTGGGPLIGCARVDAALFPTRDPDLAVIPVGTAGAWDRFAETVSVVPDSASGHLRCFYLGYRDSGFVAPAIGMMLSLDSAGTQWNRPPTPIYRPGVGAWDGVFLTGPSALRGPDGIWRIYYTGAGTTIGIGVLTSPDGVVWTPFPGNPVFERRLGQWDEAVLEPCVRFTRGHWWMWYSGYREPLGAGTRIGIGLASSDDGVHWTRVGNGPVLGPGLPGSWDDLRVLSADVQIEPDGSLLMAAYGLASRDLGVTAGSIAFWRSK